MNSWSFYRRKFFRNKLRNSMIVWIQPRVRQKKQKKKIIINRIGDSINIRIFNLKLSNVIRHWFFIYIMSIREVKKKEIFFIENSVAVNSCESSEIMIPVRDEVLTKSSDARLVDNLTTNSYWFYLFAAEFLLGLGVSGFIWLLEMVKNFLPKPPKNISENVVLVGFLSTF